MAENTRTIVTQTLASDSEYEFYANPPLRPEGPDGGAQVEDRTIRRARGVQLERSPALQERDLADENRKTLRERRVRCIHLLGGLGSGKTTLIAETLRLLGTPATVIVSGDNSDGAIFERLDVTVHCAPGDTHLSACAFHEILTRTPPPPDTVLFIEGGDCLNAEGDLGEIDRVVLLAVPQGDDKPAKFARAIARSSLLLVAKTDLLPHVPFNLETARAQAYAINPHIELLAVSAATGEGLDAWLKWVRSR